VHRCTAPPDEALPSPAATPVLATHPGDGASREESPAQQHEAGGGSLPRGSPARQSEDSRRPRLLTESTARRSVDAAEGEHGLDSPEAIIARNNLVGFLVARGGLASLEEARGLAAAVEASLVATLGALHPAAQIGRANAAAVAAAIAAQTAAPPSPPLLPPPPPPPRPAELLRPLAGKWKMDDAQSQTTAALLRYFGAPWLVVQAVTAGATPPMLLTVEEGGVRVAFPGPFTLENFYSFFAPSTHTSAFSRAQPCTLEVAAAPPGFTVAVPQAPGKGTLFMSHALEGGRCVCAIVIRKEDGSEPVRIPRIYDRC
jgi:hypothetical protein